MAGWCGATPRVFHEIARRLTSLARALLMLSKNVQLDTGVNLGITRSAPDIQTVFGVSVRF